MPPQCVIYLLQIALLIPLTYENLIYTTLRPLLRRALHGRHFLWRLAHILSQPNALLLAVRNRKS